MIRLSRTTVLLTFFMGTLILFLWFSPSFTSQVDFNTQVKPILNKYCISCHGGVQVNGDLSMMTRDDLLQAGESGKAAIVPGDPDASELYLRLIHKDEVERMPYERDPLPKSDIKVMRNWIKQGAKWGEHWAFIPVEEVAVPGKAIFMGSMGAAHKDWVRSPIDHFVLDRLHELRLSPNSEADKHTLLRRVSLDLIGMPAPASVQARFLDNSSDQAYEQLVDDLLAEPLFGERWASVWQDLARYADSKGPERDGRRDIWAYRDWLIRAFNDDLPYDRFLIEQIAGDLLPNPTDAQYVATGFHRNTQTNDEGGTNNDEWRAAAVVDRVNTTWEAIMGSTFACTQCHGHPYDPIKHEEYYEFMAYLDNTLDHDTYDDYPWLRFLSDEQKGELKELKAWLVTQGFDQQAQSIETFVRTWQPVYYSLQADSLINADIYDTKFLGMRNRSVARMPSVDLNHKDHLIFRYSSSLAGSYFTLHLDHPNGQTIASFPVERTLGWTIRELDLPKGLAGKHDLYIKYAHPMLSGSTQAPLRFDWFHFTEHFPGEGLAGYEAHKNLYWELVTASTDHTLIMVERPPGMARHTRVWDRGSWSTQKEMVEPDIPDLFKKYTPKAPKDRLELAQWLVDPKHPLTSRTIVNRIWEQLMGRGLAETLEDLGTQGIPPTHPALLEYLSYNMMHGYNWSIKRLIREIVLSATYRQASIVSTQAQEKDPFNAYYSRAARSRLSAEQIRDQALMVSGLLNPKMYGPPVMPYQPDGIWNAPYNSSQWQTATGPDRYRRAIYTFWKRSAPFPAAITFDAAPRTVCSARRIRTNTPLQALVTLNDPGFIEAAVHLAALEYEALQVAPQEAIAGLYARAIGKDIHPDKRKALLDLYQTVHLDFEQDLEATQALLAGLDPALQNPDLAALALVANSIMNLDEFITKS
ncbi:MAG: DUF1553 domain-containing protein [Saprospiraceae bacterium]|nr:DUF1553 domain-containing protein [Saprospiraceae bacterium]